MDRSTALHRLTDTVAHLYRQWDTPDSSGASALKQCTIALEREAGTQGTLIARTVGEQLGWPVFDHELLDIIAREMGLPVHDLENIDERPISWFLEAVEAFTTEHFVSENALVKYLVKTVLTLGSRGGCIIVGRGAAQILPPETTLRVRLVAPLKARIKTVSENPGLIWQDAENRVKRMDQERTQFVQQYFNRDPNHAANYDLVLNTERFAPEDCAWSIGAGLRALQARVSANPVAQLS
ncbi:MAG TPA: cytidylate kinase-like family protein [Gemmataceae bacterium]|nr:cytidylate kinase-like family protein [Gemmataceae bacterium]